MCVCVYACAFLLVLMSLHTILFFIQLAEHHSAKFFEASSLTGENCDAVSFHHKHTGTHTSGCMCVVAFLQMQYVELFILSRQFQYRIFSKDICYSFVP